MSAVKTCFTVLFLFLSAVMSFAYLILLLLPLCMSVCLSDCLCVYVFPHRVVVAQPIFKYDISTDAYSRPEGVSENQFKIKPDVKDVEKLFRKNLIIQPYFNRFESLTYGSTR